MKNTVLISCLVVMVLASSVTAYGSECIRRNAFCDVQNPQECCSRYCRNGKCINFGDTTDDDGKNPCLKLACPGQCCALRQVQCFRAPCPPIAECVKCY